MTNRAIQRTKTIAGVVTPAFIHNGPGYYVVNLQVYADGLVHCWELVDLALFGERLASGWVTPVVPDGKDLHVHGLAVWRVASGQWSLAAAQLGARVRELVRELNPRLENLHDCHGRTVEQVGKVSVVILPSPREQPVRVTGHSWAPVRVPGESLAVLVRDERAWYLADLRVFADGTIELGRIPDPQTLDRARFEAAVLDGRVASSVPAGTRIAIHELGTFTVAAELASTPIADVARTIPDLIDRANGRPDSIARCRAAHAAYLAAPDEVAREALRAAYEAVPSQNRIYIGDMDTRDRDVRRILKIDDHSKKM